MVTALPVLARKVIFQINHDWSTQRLLIVHWHTAEGGAPAELLSPLLVTRCSALEKAVGLVLW